MNRLKNIVLFMFGVAFPFILLFGPFFACYYFLEPEIGFVDDFSGTFIPDTFDKNGSFAQQACYFIDPPADTFVFYVLAFVFVAVLGLVLWQTNFMTLQRLVMLIGGLVVGFSMLFYTLFFPVIY